MARAQIGDTVRVAMPKGLNKRGVAGISVMYTTWPEARFEGAVGKVVDVKPRGTHGIPLFLVDFRGHDNGRIALPWQSQWFREEWISAERQRAAAVPTASGIAAPESTPSAATPNAAPTEERDAKAAQAEDVPPGAVVAVGNRDCPDGYPVKGNAGSMIYHLPGTSSYARTVPEFCFASEEDAVNAGFRPPRTRAR